MNQAILHYVIIGRLIACEIIKGMSVVVPDPSLLTSQHNVLTSLGILKVENVVLTATRYVAYARKDFK